MLKQLIAGNMFLREALHVPNSCNESNTCRIGKQERQTRKETSKSCRVYKIHYYHCILCKSYRQVARTKIKNTTCQLLKSIIQEMKIASC